MWLEILPISATNQLIGVYIGLVLFVIGVILMWIRNRYLTRKHKTIDAYITKWSKLNQDVLYAIHMYNEQVILGVIPGIKLPYKDSIDIHTFVDDLDYYSLFPNDKGMIDSLVAHGFLNINNS